MVSPLQRLHGLVIIFDLANPISYAPIVNRWCIAEWPRLKALVKWGAAYEVAIIEFSFICSFVSDDAAIRCRSGALIGENDSDTVRVILTRAIFGSTRIKLISTGVSHQWEL